MKKFLRLHSLRAAFILAGSACVLSAQRAPTAQKVGGIQAESTTSAYKFYFGDGKTPDGYTRVAADMTYNDTRGYGFEPGPAIHFVSKPAADGTPVTVATSAKQFYFSTALPEGNYKVTVTLGNPAVATNVSVKAELRRLMLENIQTKPGEYVTKTFIVNTRRPEYPGGVVSLKAPRESQQEAWDWDNGLTLEFNGENPSISNLQIEKVDVPTVFIVGDSTSCDQMVEPFNSWGQSITRFFKPDIAVANHGESGETLPDSLGRHRFDKVWSLMKPGDFLLVQFGHNDMKSENTDTFSADLQKVLDGTKKAGGTLILVTPMNRHTFSGNTVTNSLQGFPYAAWQFAKDNQLACVELNGMSKQLYEYFGPQGSEVLFAHTITPQPYDGTHHSDFGSYELAKCVITGLQRADSPLAKHIVDGFSFDPAKPDKPEDFKVADSPKPGDTMDHPPGS